MSERRDAAKAGAGLAHRRVLVTAPRGRVGAAVAREACTRGAVVAVAAPPSETPDPVESFIRVPAAPECENDADHVIETALAHLARLDVLIAVTALEPLVTIHEMTTGQWLRFVLDPLRTTFWLVRRATEEFLASGVAGRIVLVAEAAGGEGHANEVVACALESFARSYAREYGRRSLACNVVIPAASGPGRGTSADATLRATVEHALFLASGAASFVNGEVVVVSGRAGEDVTPC